MQPLSRAFAAPLVLLGIAMPLLASAQSLLDEATAASATDVAIPAANAVTVSDTPAVYRFESTIAQLESELGPYAPALSEQLLGLGLALQEQSQHQRAADAFKRGIHVARINGGLWSTEQIPLLRAQVKSLRALQDFSAVDQRQSYLRRLEKRALGSGRASIEALMRQAEWQREAYQMSLGRPEELAQRLRYMLDHYETALNKLIDIHGTYAPELLPALEGMLMAAYMMQGHHGPEPNTPAMENPLRLTAFLSDAYRRGKSVLRAMEEVHAANNGNDPLIRARDIQRLGDFAWLFENRDEAMANYSRAMTVANEADPSGAMAAALFAKPQALPTFEQVAPFPAPTEGDDGPLVVSFSISSSGRVRSLERLRTPDVKGRGLITRLLRQMKATRFRPAMVDGETTTTEGMVWSFDEDDWLIYQ